MADNNTHLNTDLSAVEEPTEETPTSSPTDTTSETLTESFDTAQDEQAEAQQLEDSANSTPEETAAEIAQEEEAAEKETEAESLDAAQDKKSEEVVEDPTLNTNPNAKWYVVHTFSGHENRVATTLRQRIESEHLENRIFDILVPTQDKIEIRSGKKETVKEKIFPGYILVKMELDDQAWLAVRTTQGVTAFVGMNNKPTPIPDKEVASIVKFMTQGAAPTFKDVFMVDDTVRIVDGPFTDFIGKVESVDKEKGKVRILVSIFGRETPVELDFLQVTKL